METNILNQVTQRYQHSILWSSGGAGFVNKWVYTYDDNGNATEMSRQNVSSVQQDKWVYSWNPRDQMTKAEKRTGTGAGSYAGKVEYRYCLACDGAMSERIEYSPTVSTTITSWKRYEYDGLNLVRIDERYDTGGGSIDSNDPWRVLEFSTHGPGQLANLHGKRFYVHTNNDHTPDSTVDYSYGYDHVGNVIVVFSSAGAESYYFSQDAFGNELNVGVFTGSSWATARTNGINEHQTGKWIDPFTGLYYFHARWMDPTVGRFVQRSSLRVEIEEAYLYCSANPVAFADPTDLPPS